MARCMSSEPTPFMAETAAREATVSRRRILVVDADAASASALQQRLQQAGFEVTALTMPEQVLAGVQSVQPDLVVLDWDHPGALTADVVARIRQARGARAPRVLVLSAMSGEQQVVAGFEAGADDYVIKPYSMAELMARVRALLRGRDREEEGGEVLRFQELLISGQDFRLTVRGTPVALRGSEYRLLEFLVRHPERAFSRAQLLDRVWGRDTHAEERAIDVTVQRLRKALARHGCAGYVQTVRSVGYRISAALEPRRDAMAGE
jgi:two-component system, OmpR family, phosphate regulon response regulator PhoB